MGSKPQDPPTCSGLMIWFVNFRMQELLSNFKMSSNNFLMKMIENMKIGLLQIISCLLGNFFPGQSKSPKHKFHAFRISK